MRLRRRRPIICGTRAPGLQGFQLHGLIWGPQQLEQGFGAHYTIITTRNPQNSIGNYLGPYSIVRGGRLGTVGCGLKAWSRGPRDREAREPEALLTTWTQHARTCPGTATKLLPNVPTPCYTLLSGHIECIHQKEPKNPGKWRNTRSRAAAQGGAKRL